MSLDVTIPFKDKEGNEDHWWSNITHNMTRMAHEIPIEYPEGNNKTLYDFVWRPDEQDIPIDTSVMKEVLIWGIVYMIQNRTKLLEYNPENGWGSYSSFLDWLISYKSACEDHPGCKIEVSR